MGEPHLVTGRPPGSPLSTAAVRSGNLALILGYLHTHGPTSRGHLAERTGLSRASVTSLVGDLQARGLVATGEAARLGHVGRPSSTVSVATGRVAGIGAETTPNSLRVIVRDLAGGIVWEETRATPGRVTPPELIRALTPMLREAMHTARDAAYWVAGITLAPSGLVDPSRRRVLFSTHFGWRDVPLAHMLHEALAAGSEEDAQPPVRLEHDAMLSALSELTRMHREHIDSYVFLTGDQGVAAGIVAEGRIVTGWNQIAGEIGHIPVGPPENLCRCGRRGCWETLVGLDVLLADAPDGSALAQPDTSLRDRMLQARALLARHDPQLTAAVDRIGHGLVLGASVLVDLLNPRALVLGGYFGELSDVLIDPLQRALEGRQLDVTGDVRLYTAEYGLDAACMGGAMSVLNRVVADPLIVPPLEVPRTAAAGA